MESSIQNHPGVLRLSPQWQVYQATFHFEKWHWRCTQCIYMCHQGVQTKSIQWVDKWDQDHFLPMPVLHSLLFLHSFIFPASHLLGGSGLELWSDSSRCWPCCLCHHQWPWSRHSSRWRHSEINGFIPMEMKPTPPPPHLHVFHLHLTAQIRHWSGTKVLFYFERSSRTFRQWRYSKWMCSPQSVFLSSPVHPVESHDPMMKALTVESQRHLSIRHFSC